MFSGQCAVDQAIRPASTVEEEPPSEYGVSYVKSKIRRIYGVLVGQFRLTYKQAEVSAVLPAKPVADS